MDGLAKTQILTEQRRQQAVERRAEIARLNPPWPFTRRRFDPRFFGRPATRKPAGN